MFGFEIATTADPARGPDTGPWRRTARYVLVLGIVAALSEGLRWTPVDRGWQGLITLAASLVCAWFGGIGPATCLPPLLMLLSRLHEDQARTSFWPTLGEVIIYALYGLMVVSIGAAGQYRRRIQAITREHSQKLQNHARALDRAHIIFRDLDGRVSEWSDGLYSLFGWTREEALGRKVHELLKSQFLQPIHTIQEELLLTGEWQGEFLTHQKSGSLLNIATHWILYRDPNGKPIGIAEVYNDVTDLRRAEAAVREADRRKQEFLATLAHELRNPLAPVSNSLQIMRLSDELSPSMQRLREIMEQQVGHIVRLVDDLLDVSRVTCGKIMLKRERILLAELVANAVEMVRRQVEESQLELSVSLPTEPLFLDVDPIRIAQVVSNLLGNAVKYTEPGGHIWLSAIHHDNELTLTVRDTGAGIPPDMLEHIFQMFNQVDRTLTRSSGGLGIGLTLAKSLVELHGGSITAESDGPGQGSLFTIRLPIQSDIEKRNEQRPRIECDPARQIPKSRRVLVVDDMHSVGYVLGRLLEKLGQSVELARGGHEALQAIAKQRPDVVFSDIAMPHMDGYELARQIRRDPKLRGVVLVALTGFGQAADRERAFAAGFDHHLVKPAGMEALRQILSQTDRVDEKSVDVCHDMTIERGSH